MLTVVMPYYKNRGMLERHIKEWKSYPPELMAQMQFVIVDDGSPDGEDAFPVAAAAGLPNLTLFKIGVDIPWNQDGARNLGMTGLKGWCLLTDIDHLLTAESARAILEYEKRNGVYYVLGRRKANGEPKPRHPNTYLIQGVTYWKTGGYNEEFRGYYGTDGHFKKLMNTVAKGIDLFDIELVLFGREVIPDASTRDLGRKDSPYNIKNNPALYAKLKDMSKSKHTCRFEWERLL